MTKTETMQEWELFISPRPIAIGLLFFGLVLILASDYLAGPELVRPAIGTLFILFSLEGWNDLLWPCLSDEQLEQLTIAGI